MKTKGAKENFRVVITPRGIGDFGSIRVSDSFFYGDGEKERQRFERDMQERCDDIADAVRRHVDNARYVEVKFVQEDVCEHCGAPWTEDSATYNGGCCDKDEENATQQVAA